MAKQPSPKGGTSRVRFIMLEAEIPEGDLSQITTAIQNALKPSTTIIQQRLPTSSSPVALPNESHENKIDIDGSDLILQLHLKSFSDSLRVVSGGLDHGGCGVGGDAG